MRQMLTLFAVLGAIAATAPAQEPFFLQMADPQFGMYTNNVGFAQETANLEFAIATANRLHPAFVVMAGDLVNKSGDPAQVAEYLRVTHLLNPAIPLYNVAGNHDVGNSPTAASLEAYRKIFGKDYYTFRPETSKASSSIRASSSTRSMCWRKKCASASGWSSN
jgi:serine/threonine-protein phosphatase CPPED1